MSWTSHPGVRRRPIFAAIVFLALSACATTTFTSTWKAPDVQVLDPTGKKVAAVFISKDESTRRAAEDELVQRLNARGAQAVAAYTLIPSDQLENMDLVKSKLTEAGVEGVVTMRIIEEKQRVRYEPADPTFWPYYTHFSRYWGYGWGAVYAQPPRVTTEDVVLVETLVYSLSRDQLLWAGTSRTVNPRDVPKFVNELADAAAKEMRKQGLLAS